MKEPRRETNSTILRQAAMRRLRRRVGAEGSMSFPAVPSLIEHYVHVLSNTFALLGRPFNAEEAEQLRVILRDKLAEAYRLSPNSKIHVSYITDAPPSEALNYKVSYGVSTIADEYQNWVNNRQEPLFGKHPDSKVMTLAHSLGEPAQVRVLDIGAGTGRNTLPLAQAGFVAEAVELAPALAEILKRDAAQAGLNVHVFEGDVLDRALEIPSGRYQLLILAEVIASHARSVAEVRRWFERFAELLAPGGLVVFSAFLVGEGYKPDSVVRELSEVFWCTAFLRSELAEAMKQLPLKLISDESAYEFEKAHLPEAAWPPTGWFEEWVDGQDLFDLPHGKSPLTLRWLVYQKQ